MTKCKYCEARVRNQEQEHTSTITGSVCKKPIIELGDPIGTVMRAPTSVVRVAQDPLGSINDISRSLFGISIW